MIDINYENDVDLVRSNIGDPNSEFVTDSTVISALAKMNNDVIKASILVMETMLSWFLTQAEESRTGQVEIRFRKLYERYKSRLQEFQDKNASRFGAGIIFGGVSLEEVNRVNNDSDSFNMWLHDTYTDLAMSQRLILEEDKL